MRGFVELRQAASCSFISAWQCVYPKNRLCLGEEGDEARLRPRDVVMRGVAAEFPVLARGHASFSTSGMLSAARAVRVRPTGLTVSPAGSGTRTSLARRLQSLHVDAYAVRQFRRRHGAASSDDRAECVVVRHLPARAAASCPGRAGRVRCGSTRITESGSGAPEGEWTAGHVRRGVQQGRRGRRGCRREPRGVQQEQAARPGQGECAGDVGAYCAISDSSGGSWRGLRSGPVAT